MIEVNKNEPSLEEHSQAICAVDLWRIYQISATQEVQALRGVDLSIKQGKFVALKGRSGSGKTTLLNCLGGLDFPTKGKVEIFGQLVTQMDEQQLTLWRRSTVGFVFQSFGLIPTLSAFENVELAARILGGDPKQNHELVKQYIDKVGLTKWINHRPNELSGGQQQRVAIARSLINRPRLILADEPTGELDSTTGSEILTLFRKIVDEEKINILISTHDKMVDEYVDQIINFQDGQVFDAGLT